MRHQRVLARQPAGQAGDAQLTNNPGFTTTSPEAVIRKATMLEGPSWTQPSSPSLASVNSPKTKPAAAHPKKRQSMQLFYRLAR